MKICFHNFWNGFADRSDPVHIGFFLQLFTDVFRTDITVSNPGDADVLVESVFGDHSMVALKRWNYIFCFTGEAYYHKTTPLEFYSCILGFRKGDTYVPLPFFIPYITCNPSTYIPVSVFPTDFACVVIANPEGAVRNRFLDALEQRARVSYGGSFRNNIGHTIQGRYNSNNLLDFYRRHRFVITMENACEDYYITEKIINGFRAGVIPVYWGTPRVMQYFNPRRFLYLPDDTEESMQALVETMLTMSDAEYMSRVNEPVFLVDEPMEPVVQDIQRCLGLD